MVVETVLFDLDDTLFDHRHARLAGLQAIRQAQPELRRFPVARLDRSLERLLTDIHLRLVLTGKVTHDEGRWLRMVRFLEEYQIRLPRQRIQALIDLRVATYERHLRAVPGAAALLRHLHESGRVIGVVTNNLRSEQEEKLRVTGLEEYVDHLVCSEQVGVTKPNPRIFRVALQRTGGTPRTAVMVGDSWAVDVVGAIRLGIPSVWFHRDSRPRPRSPVARELRSFRPLAHAARVILTHRPPAARPRPKRR